jgi:hypothetical protein
MDRQAGPGSPHGCDSILGPRSVACNIQDSCAERNVFCTHQLESEVVTITSRLTGIQAFKNNSANTPDTWTIKNWVFAFPVDIGSSLVYPATLLFIADVSKACMISVMPRP